MIFRTLWKCGWRKTTNGMIVLVTLMDMTDPSFVSKYRVGIFNSILSIDKKDKKAKRKEGVNSVLS